MDKETDNKEQIKEQSQQQQKPELISEKEIKPEQKSEDEQKPEKISEEELKELNEDLLKSFSNSSNKDETKTLKILNLLFKKIITVQLLQASKIGKTLTLISSKSDHYFADRAIQDKANHLLYLWKKVNRDYKKQKEQQEKQEEEELEVPHFPQKIKQKLDMMGKNGKIGQKFIEILQTHPQVKEGIKYDKEFILKAAEIGFEIGQKMVQQFQQQKLQEKFRLLVFALTTTNPAIKLSLLNGDIQVDQLIQMEEKDLASDELKQKIKEQSQYVMQANRSDAFLELEKKKGTQSSMYSCGKCKSNQVTCRTQQTRGADEPMTEFYNCRNCGKSWKICP